MRLTRATDAGARGGKKVGRYNKTPRIPVAKIENNAIAVKFIQNEGIKLVNISGEDIHSGNARIILGLIWSLILRYQINGGKEDRDGNPNTSAKDELLEWVRSKIGEETPYNYKIGGFKKDWNDGRALNALQDALQPGMCPGHKELPTEKAAWPVNCQKGLDAGYDEWGVPKLLEGADMAHPRIDEMSMMTYISYYRDLDPSKFKKEPVKDPAADANASKAYGPGLVEGVAGEPAPFKVETPADTTQELVVKVFGPDGAELPASGVTLTKEGDGKHSVVYEPKEPGMYKIHVTLGGFHIPGSVFTVEVLEDESLGGEGKIITFYSTTASSNKGRSDVVNLQRLLEAKKIHLRPDFEPWIPVDIMERDDREAVFKKAGTRNLPIVFIDDVYAGDYDTLQKYEEEGKLDQMLRYNENL